MTLDQQNRSAKRQVAAASCCKALTQQAKFFTEVRILQRQIKVRLLSAPVSLGNAPFPSGPTPAAAAKSGNSGLPALPAPGAGATVIIGMA